MLFTFCKDINNTQFFFRNTYYSICVYYRQFFFRVIYKRMLLELLLYSNYIILVLYENYLLVNFKVDC